MSAPYPGRRRACVILVLFALASAACSIGPKYQRPSAAVPPAFKEQPPPAFKEMTGWKPGQPLDGQIRGKWWELFGDQQLNGLEEQVNINSNQALAQSEAQFRLAQATIHATRAGLYPTVSTTPSLAEARNSSNRGISGGAAAKPTFDIQLPFSASYEPDFWGRVHKAIAGNIANAQASAADMETARLSIQATLAEDYFQMRGLDAQYQLLESTVEDYQKALDLTMNRYKQGVASRLDVVQAENQMHVTRAEATDTLVQRAQFEHAIAVLIGKTPAEFSLPVAPISVKPPQIPFGIPSELLERRPDIAANERRVAAANEQIGIAMAAFYPTLNLNASGGLDSRSLVNLFTWGSRFWSLGPSMSQLLFDAGRRKAITEEAMASYDATVAAYRESVLTAFEDVEDNLSALRVLDVEAQQQDEAVKSSQRALELSINQYKGGITNYLQVITAQEASLGTQRTAFDILTRRMTASVLLVKAVGGGWTASELPQDKDLVAQKIHK